MEKSYDLKQFKDIELHKQDIYVFQHELTTIVPQHKHTQGHILFVMDGVATMDVEHSAYYIPYGYFVWIPPQISHRISFDGKNIKLLNIYYPPTFTESEFYQQVRMFPIPSILYHTFEIVQEKNGVYKECDWQHELLSTVIHILPHIVKGHLFPLRLPTTNHPIALKIVDAIHKRYQTQLTATDISEEVGLSVRTLSRYLRSELDTSFTQYLRTFRILMAIREMVKNEESITNIAYSVGYESLTAFSNSFYKITGYRPSQFLKNGEE